MVASGEIDQNRGLAMADSREIQARGLVWGPYFFSLWAMLMNSETTIAI